MKLYEQIKETLKYDGSFNDFRQPRIYTNHFQEGNFVREMLETAIEAMIAMINIEYEPYYYSAPKPFIGNIVVNEREYQVYHYGGDREAYFTGLDEQMAIKDLNEIEIIRNKEKTPDNLVELFTKATMSASRLGYKLEPLFDIIIEHKKQKTAYFGEILHEMTRQRVY